VQRLDERILRKIVGERMIGAHAAQQVAHEAGMAAHQFAIRIAIAGGRQANKLDLGHEGELAGKFTG